MSKIAIILHAEPGTHDAMGRAFHALLYAKELKENGIDVRLVFDGGGTKWVEELSRPDHMMHPVFAEVKKLGVIDGVCDFCIGAFEADRDAIGGTGLPVVGDYMQHPSIFKYVSEGYQIITL